MLQDGWKRELGIDVGLRNQEWGVFLDTVRLLDYQAARASWIGDYADPNTFLEMFMSQNENNQTGWKNREYDRLMTAAASEGDAPKRAKMLHDAESILMHELPILPIYYYVSRDMVRPYVQGFHQNVRDEHPLWAISVDVDAKRRVLAEER
jgi:oligopeptide transport system substrate-binding protein